MNGFAAELLMEPVVGTATGAGCGEKSAERLAQRNGYRDRDWQTRAGTVKLRIPTLQTEVCYGDAHPPFAPAPAACGLCPLADATSFARDRLSGLHRYGSRRICSVAHNYCTMQEILTAICDPTRRAALSLVWDGGEHCVCELMARLDVSQSRMSRHMKVLREASLVLDRRDAQWVRYRRNPNLVPEFAAVIDAVMAAEGLSQRRVA